MSARTGILAATVALTLLFAYLTFDVLIRDGFSVLIGVSLLILALFCIGAIGALTHPPDE